MSKEPKTPSEEGWRELPHVAERVESAFQLFKPGVSDDWVSLSRAWEKGPLRVISSYDALPSMAYWSVSVSRYGRKAREEDVEHIRRVFGLEGAHEAHFGTHHRMLRVFDDDITTPEMREAYLKVEREVQGALRRQREGMH